MGAGVKGFSLFVLEMDKRVWLQPGAYITKMCFLPVWTLLTLTQARNDFSSLKFTVRRHGYHASDQTCNGGIRQEMMLDEEEAGGALGWLGTSLASSTTSPCLTPGLVSTLKEKSGRRLSFSSGIPAKLFQAGSEMGTMRQEQIEGPSLSCEKQKLVAGLDQIVARSCVFSFWIFINILRSGGERWNVNFKTKQKLTFLFYLLFSYFQL